MGFASLQSERHVLNEGDSGDDSLGDSRGAATIGADLRDEMIERHFVWKRDQRTLRTDGERPATARPRTETGDRRRSRARMMRVRSLQTSRAPSELVREENRSARYLAPSRAAASGRPVEASATNVFGLLRVKTGRDCSSDNKCLHFPYADIDGIGATAARLERLHDSAVLLAPQRLNDRLCFR